MSMSSGQEAPWSEATILQLLTGVCLGVKELHHHSPPLAHRDIKPENVLLNQRDLIPVLVDFGSMGRAEIRVTNRSEALLVQDDAATNRCVCEQQIFDYYLLRLPAELITSITSILWFVL